MREEKRMAQMANIARLSVLYQCYFQGPKKMYNITQSMMQDTKMRRSKEGNDFPFFAFSISTIFYLRETTRDIR